MKHGLAVLLSLLLLVGCGPGGRTRVSAAELVTRPFTSRIALDWCGEDYTGLFTWEGQGGLSLTLSGDSLAVPISFVCAQGGCAIAQGELSLTLDEAELPSSSLPSSLLRAFVQLQGAEGKSENGQLFLQAGPVQLTCREEDGAFSRLALERGSMEFTEFAFTAAS